MELPFISSICHQCRGCVYGGNRRGTVFLRCTLRPERYLPQPMRRCSAFEPKDDDAHAGHSGGDADYGHSGGDASS